MNDTVDYDLHNFKKEERFKFLHPFWEAIFSFNPLQFYVLLVDSIDLKNEDKQTLTEEVYRCFCTHKFFGDDELILFFYKDQLNNKNFLDCDFMGVNTGFSTVLRFEFDHQKVTAIYFVKPEHDMVIDRVVDLYSLDEIEGKVWNRHFKSKQDK